MRPVRSPWRSPASGRPSVPLRPDRMPLLRGGRPLKLWRYVGVFGPELSLCVACVRVGVVRRGWWVVWDRVNGGLREGGVRGAVVAPGCVVVPGVLDLRVWGGAAVETVSPHGSEYAQTRKVAGARANGWLVTASGARVAVDAPALVDESAGYHARHTAWRWSAGAGVAVSGATVAWNLVAGLHDANTASERTVWLDGEPHEVGPVTFADDLSAVRFAEGGELRFTAEATRARHENLLLVRSDYEQPFGRFTGVLPGAGELREGFGVMERHAVWW